MAITFTIPEKAAMSSPEPQPEQVQPNKVLDLGTATGRLLGFSRKAAKPIDSRIFDSGAQRDTDIDKPRIDLLSPFARARTGQVAYIGANKYGIRNWEKGMPLSVFLASANRHMNQFMQGDTSEDHIAHCTWNLEAIMHGQEMIQRGIWPETYNDLPQYTTATPRGFAPGPLP